MNKDHISELARVTKPGGWIILSVPKSTSFIYNESVEANKPGYRIIKNDPFGGLRNGEILKNFNSAQELAGYLKNHCDYFSTGDINDDCFGFAYHWYLIVARKKS